MAEAQPLLIEGVLFIWVLFFLDLFFPLWVDEIAS